MAHLKGLKSLLTLGAFDTKITARGVADLQKALPKLGVAYKISNMVNCDR